jgi:hypothetical protein
MNIINLLEKGFVQLCKEHAQNDFRLISEVDCDRCVDKDTFIKVFEKEENEYAFEAYGVRNWFLGKKAYVVAVPNYKMNRALTIHCVANCLKHMFEHWVHKIENMKNNMDVFYYFLPKVKIEKLFIGYRVTLTITTMSGRYID